MSDVGLNFSAWDIFVFGVIIALTSHHDTAGHLGLGRLWIRRTAPRRSWRWDVLRIIAHNRVQARPPYFLRYPLLDCEKAQHELLVRSRAGSPQAGAQCVATDDPRLKGN
jgi:hypothetical protein